MASKVLVPVLLLVSFVNLLKTEDTTTELPAPETTSAREQFSPSASCPVAFGVCNVACRSDADCQHLDNPHQCCPCLALTAPGINGLFQQLVASVFNLNLNRNSSRSEPASKNACVPVKKKD